MASADKESFVWARLSCPCDERYCGHCVLGKGLCFGTHESGMVPHHLVETLVWVSTGIGLNKPLNLSTQSMCHSIQEQHLSTARSKVKHQDLHYLSNSSSTKLGVQSLLVAHLKTQMWHCTPSRGETWTPHQNSDWRPEPRTQAHCLLTGNCSPGVRTYWNSGSFVLK